jgi:biopolymer transport protein ExbD
MKRHRRDLEVMSELNLTNLLDTAFTLLIAFMLVAPSVKHGIELDLPQVSRQNMSTEPETVTIVIQKQQLAGAGDLLYIDDKRLDLAGIQDFMQNKLRANPKVSVVIEADKNATYDTFAKLVGLIQNVGIENIGLTTEPVDLATVGKKEEKK